MYIMSVVPIFNALFAGMLLFSLFTWRVKVLLFSLFCGLISILMYLVDTPSNGRQYKIAFWLFILREAIIFGTLGFCCLYFDCDYYMNLSRSKELPFLGCFLLLGSSLTASSCHRILKWDKGAYSLLCYTIFLGLMFVIVQMWEMDEIVANIYDSRFYASCFCTVGLHFRHVVLGLIGLSIVAWYGPKNFGYYRSTLVIWYWHFVDYVWIFVYIVVYVC